MGLLRAIKTYFLVENLDNSSIGKSLSASIVKTDLAQPTDWQAAFDLIENSNSHILLVGMAGTGKSTFVRQHLGKNSKKVTAFLAPTGVSALNIQGQTIHSFCHFRPEIEIMTVSNAKLYRKFDRLVIDEVSMVSCRLLDGLDEFMRLNGRNRNLPFGGCQIVLVGDPYQLPPVINNAERALLRKLGYKSEFFWHSKVFTTTAFHYVKLTTNFRHSSEIVPLFERMAMADNTPEDLALLNSRVVETPSNDGRIRLVPTNDDAHSINHAELKKLGCSSRIYRASLEGSYNKKPQKSIEQWLPCDLELELKPGAQVIFIRNHIDGKTWVNGTLGIVDYVESTHVGVRIGTTVHSVTPATWEENEYNYNSATGTVETKTIGKVTQIPLRLAWALTIHKAQGLTFDKLHADVCGCFAGGQAYVAISRCRSVAGLELASPAYFNDIAASPLTVKFMQHFSDMIEAGGSRLPFSGVR